MTPKVLREEITELKSLLTDPNGKFGVDLAIPQVGGSARKTNHDYTHGHLPELIDIIVEEGAALFVCAVGKRERKREVSCHVYYHSIYCSQSTPFSNSYSIFLSFF